VICGHVHEARDARLAGASREGRLVVMADFERSGCHVSFLEGELSLHARDERFEQPGPAGVVVAVDGPAGSGKSSVCRALADELGFLLLDSGALYRTVTARALAADVPLTGPALGELAAGLDLAVSASGAVLLDGQPVPDELLRGPEVSGKVSQVSADPAVREALMPVQRAAAGVGAGLVAEGRDMASVVFPDADVAVYLDARPEVRAARRMAQNPGEGRTLEEVTAALRERDERDSGRAHAPLTRADGAVLVDTSELSPTQVVQRLVELVRAARR